MAHTRPLPKTTGLNNRLYWAAPYVAVVVFAMTMLVLVLMLQRQENEVQQNAIARDVQWAEQTMRLHMQGTEEFLTQMARDLAAGVLDRDDFQVRANQHIANNPQLINLAWVGEDETVRWSAPFDTTDWLTGDALTATQSTPYFHARDVSRAVYGEAYVNTRGVAVLEVYVPVRHGRRFLGAMVGVYSIDRMVRHLVPDWFSEKYRIAFISARGQQFAVNSSVEALDENVAYAIELDPPGNGLSLRATAFREVGDVPRALPVTLIVGLSFFVLWSLWLLRGHTVRRVRVEKERDRLFNLSLDILSIFNADGTFRRCNPAFEQLLGYPSAEMPGRTLLEFVHEDDVGATVEQLRQLSVGRPVNFENRMRCDDGRYKWLAWSVNPVPEERLLYAVAHDVTGRKDSEEALRAESAFRRAMEESVITGLRAIDLTGRITYVNPAFCRLVGRDADELVGAEAPFPYWPEDRLDICQANLDMTLSGQAPPTGFEMQIVRKNGERIDTRFYLSPLIDSEGKQTGWMASMTDITEPKRVRAALESAQARFEAVLDGLDSAVFVADPNTDEILYANRAFMALHGFDAVGRSARKVADPQPEQGDYRVDPRRLSPADVPVELFDGELRHALSGRWYHVREQATRWVDGRVVRMAIATDITDRRQMQAMARQQEERLQRTARLVTMGEMASTLAHELNQPLAAISNYSMGCVRRLESGEYKEADLLAAMQKASFQAERAGKIIRRIRDFVRKAEPRRSAVPLVDIVEDAVGFAEIDARKSAVVIERDISKHLPPVFADRIMIEQVVLNLVKNAIDAMTDVPEAERHLRISARQTEAVIEIAVADRGHGIHAEDVERLFTPFYTTKSEGMGMGLNICRSIIEYHDGRLWIEPNPEGGTVFRFTLPVEIASERDARRA